MQEGAGVRQMIEDELQQRGVAAARPRRPARARPAGVGHERGPRRLRRHLHLAHVGRVRPRRGHARRGAGRGARARARDLARARRAAGPRRAPAGRSSSSPASGCRDRPLVARRAAGRARRARDRAAVPRREPALGRLARAAAWRARGRRCRRTGSRSPPGADGILAIGGGSAIDTAKAASAAIGLPLVSVPTTYSGAEWTPSFGVRDARPPHGRRRRRRAPRGDRLRRRPDARPAAAPRPSARR